MKRIFSQIGQFALIAALATSTFSCSNDDTDSKSVVTGGDNTQTDSGNGSEEATSAKYVFLFIGDGMAAPQINLAEAAYNFQEFKDSYQNQAVPTKSSVGIATLNLREMPIVGMCTTHAENRYITGSAASATALATGRKTNIDHLSVDPADTSVAMATIAEMARDKGMKVGIVSSVSIDHATPAAFYAHTDNRNNYSTMREALLNSEFDYFAGGSVRWNKLDRTDNAAGIDKAAKYEEFKTAAAAKGFKYVEDKASFDALQAGEDQAVIATLKMLAQEQYTGDGSALPYAMDLYLESEADNQITLADFVQKGIEILDNEQGFLMSIESGKIDWACHAQDAAASTYDMLAFDEAIGKAIAFAKQHPTETLIVVTGDHDTGGLTLGFAGTGYETSFEFLANQKMSFQKASEAVAQMIAEGKTSFLNDALPFVFENFGFTNSVENEGVNANTSSKNRTMELSDYEVEEMEKAWSQSVGGDNMMPYDEDDIYFADFSGYDPFVTKCLNILNNKAGLDFTSYKHTAVPVPVFAMGANQELFNGYYDNTDVAKRIIEAAGLK